ncbi:hypothetical protein PDN41_30515 [Bacillus cereus]|nr:hypothetical protein [Bacillus cereus]
MLMIVRAFSFSASTAGKDNSNPKEFTEANFEDAKGGNATKKYRSLIDKGPVLFLFYSIYFISLYLVFQ